MYSWLGPKLLAQFLKACLSDQTSKAMGRTITDLHFDLLKYIMILVAQSPDGAANLARAISVSRVFMEVAKDRNVLKAVVFENVKILDRYKLFLSINGLLNRCAQVGHFDAQFLLAETILLSTSQLWRRGYRKGRSTGDHRLRNKAYFSKIPKEDVPAAFFVAHFVPGNAHIGKAACQSFSHYGFVKLFLRHCNSYDLAEMRPHLNRYLEYFLSRRSTGRRNLMDSLCQMFTFGDRVRAFVELGDIKKRLNTSIELLTKAAEVARQGNVNPVLQKKRYEAVEEATLKCGTIVLELKVKSQVLGLAFEAVYVQTLKAMGKTVIDLQFDLLKDIMIFVARSPNGAANLARAISVSRVFMKAAEDKNVLKVVVFDNVWISNQYKLFRQINGLLNRCAQAGNVAAQYFLAKTVLLNSSELCKRLEIGWLDGDDTLSDEAHSSEIPKENFDPATYFMAHFVPENGCIGKASFQSLTHYELVKLFLHQCNPYDLNQMHVHLKSYLDYFIVPGTYRRCIMKGYIDEIHSFCDRVRTLVALGDVKDRLNYHISLRSEVTLFESQGNDCLLLLDERLMAIEEETLRCVAADLELRVRSWVPGLDFEAVFSENVNLEANMQYHHKCLEWGMLEPCSEADQGCVLQREQEIVERERESRLKPKQEHWTKERTLTKLLEFRSNIESNGKDNY